MKNFLLISAFIVSSLSFASTSNTVRDTSEAVTEALLHFENNAQSSDVDIFKGVKASPVERGVAVGIYLSNGAKISYLCHRHEDSDPFECHQAN